jgi:putative nucleotidyltransferase with HDIG domain
MLVQLRVTSPEVRLAKNGKPYLAFIGITPAGLRVSCRQWDTNEVPGDYISAVIREDAYRGEKQYIIQSYEASSSFSLAEPEMPWEWDSRRFPAILKKALYSDRISSILPATFETHPGGRMKHHSYRGGLLEHSVETAEISASICKSLRLSERETGLSIAGALVHDIGKCEEIAVSDGAYELSDVSKTTGWNSSSHLYLGLLMIPSDFPELEFFRNVILSHHGPYGPVAPASIPAKVIHLADMASSNVNSMKHALLNNEEARDRDGARYARV